MVKQEVSTYATVDYLAAGYQQRLLEHEEATSTQNSLELSSSADSSFSDTLTSTSTSTAGGNGGAPSEAEGPSTATSASSNTNGITELWREKICEWCYQVVDHFDFQREVVSITMNYLDRYLARKTVSKRFFQLAAMASLSLAVKLHTGPTTSGNSSQPASNLSMSSMLSLSRGYFTVKQMEAMEMSIMITLGWHLHPPTSLTLTKHLLFLLPLPGLSFEARHNIMELARFLNELSVIDYFFVPHRPSHVAVAALANTMDELSTIIPRDSLCVFSELLSKLDLDLQDPAVLSCRHRLQLLYAQGGYAATQPSTSNQGTASGARQRPEANPSPVSVAFGTASFREETVRLAENKDDSES
ncbi:hypothetical protein ACA910_021840 [Epithemia clementina (nom. ined.)]